MKFLIAGEVLWRNVLLMSKKPFNMNSWRFQWPILLSLIVLVAVYVWQKDNLVDFLGWRPDMVDNAVYIVGFMIVLSLAYLRMPKYVGPRSERPKGKLRYLLLVSGVLPLFLLFFRVDFARWTGLDPNRFLGIGMLIALPALYYSLRHTQSHYDNPENWEER